MQAEAQYTHRGALGIQHHGCIRRQGWRSLILRIDIWRLWIQIVDNGLTVNVLDVSSLQRAHSGLGLVLDARSISRWIQHIYPGDSTVVSIV